MSDTLLLNVGNTNTEVGVVESGSFRFLDQFPTVLLHNDTSRLHSLVEERPLPWLAACVVPAVRTLLEAEFGTRFRVLQASMLDGVDVSAVDAGTVGSDRLANCAAAVAEQDAPVIVLDCGTAVTTEVIDRQYRFIGGAIMPGRGLARRALHAGTGLLPAVDTDAGAAFPQAVGANTRDAILAGTELGAVGAVREILSATRRQLGEPDCPVLVTGGDARFFVSRLSGAVAARPHFSLYGLSRVAAVL